MGYRRRCNIGRASNLHGYQDGGGPVIFFALFIAGFISFGATWLVALLLLLYLAIDEGIETLRNYKKIRDR